MKKYRSKQSWKDKFIENLQHGTKESVLKAFNEKNAHIPDTLFRYRSCNEYAIDEIKNQYVYMSKPSDFNDPFDSSARNAIKDMILKDKKLKIHLDNIKKNIGESYDDNIAKTLIECVAQEEDKNVSNYIQNDLRIACFTDVGSDKKPINLPMWYHYADKYQGICIEYDMKNFLKEHQASWLLPVKYTNKPLKFLHHIKDVENSAAELLISIHKDRTWSYENEWRFVLCENFCSKDQKYKNSAIKSVYIGYKASDQIRNGILSLSKNMFKVYNMKLNYDCIDFEEL